MSNKNQSFQSLYQQHWAELYAFAYNVMHDKQQAEDIVQDIFVDLWNRYDDLTVNHYRGYLFQSVKNQCAKRFGKSSVKEVHIETWTAFLSDVEEPVYEDIKRQLLDEIETTANRILPAKCLKIFKMRFYESRSYKEISQQLQISESTVENQITKALKLLKDSTRYITDIHLVILLLIQFSVN